MCHLPVGAVCLVVAIAAVIGVTTTIVERKKLPEAQIHYGIFL